MTDAPAPIPPPARRRDEFAATPDRDVLRDRFAAVRAFTTSLCTPLELEDYVLQAMPDVSPTKWHLAHTTWFFERFVLQEFVTGYMPWNPDFGYLFNSYYHTVGSMHARADRGKLSRPTVAEVRAYRAAIDERLFEFVECARPDSLARAAAMVELGCHHEQQHQELILTDIKYNFSRNPLLPVYHMERKEPGVPSDPDRLAWLEFEGGLCEIGLDGPAFHFDNESPRHEALIPAHAIAARLVTNGEFLEFVDAGGYTRSELWLDAGFAAVSAERRAHPLYWFRADGEWRQYTLAGAAPLAACEPVVHVDFFEADAYARWSGRRLPTEAEWEVAAASQVVEGNFADTGRFHVEPASAPDARPQQFFGDVWEWTASPYVGYPGYRSLPGSVGEYNGKFMCNQLVLRGGSCVTSRSHVRASYRNFFPPEAQWQFSGIRLAEDR
jgi:ergothioneine biosynthesis protein EgtB